MQTLINSFSKRSFQLIQKSKLLRQFASIPQSPFEHTEKFVDRHIGPNDVEIQEMLKVIGFKSLDDFTNSTVPKDIHRSEMKIPEAQTETQVLNHLKKYASMNRVTKSFLGMGFNDVEVPSVIIRNILENPKWYTSYTPYQAEISQGRLESLLNFQTVICDLTHYPVCNASLLDEATAMAEALHGAYSQHRGKRTKVFISSDCHPQNIDVVKTRAGLKNIEVVVGDINSFKMTDEYCGCIVQYPGTFGDVRNYEQLTKDVHKHKGLVIAAADLLSLTMLKPPAEMDIDMTVGSTQHLGLPLGFGGPHAGFFATKNEYIRKMPGRIVGVTIDNNNKKCLRLAMQTREQHIKRDLATSNICTAQALLANMSAFYAIYHGPDGLKAIATRVHNMAVSLSEVLKKSGFEIPTKIFFDTFVVNVKGQAKEIFDKAHENGILLRVINDDQIGISIADSCTKQDLNVILQAIGCKFCINSYEIEGHIIPDNLIRTSKYLTNPIFNTYHSETQMMRYMSYLESKDLSLTYSMIPLGSCTMKLNSASSMLPITWPEFSNIHPYAPQEDCKGYTEMITSMKHSLEDITGFDGCSFQPNSGANGEFSGLTTISRYLKANNAGKRKICLIPRSAHGTNPASCVQAGFKPIVVNNTESGNIDQADFAKLVNKYHDDLACVMITYPSTYGIYEDGIKGYCKMVHEAGGQVYMDGANMNAQVGLTSPGLIGADVCHLNLHKTFGIPHGGGGPGVGSILCKKHLIEYLPSHPVIPIDGGKYGAVSSGPYGSASILPITYTYLNALGREGLKKATQVAMLNANYMAKRLEKYYKVLFQGPNGCVAHEFILDMSPFKQHGITESDVAKRLIDYGFHAPTMSFPVHGTLMVEPTESEYKAELDRFCDAMISIRHEIDDVISGKFDKEDNVLHNAPHTLPIVLTSEWNHKYTRELAVFPSSYAKNNKLWPTCGRVNDLYGDTHLAITREGYENEIPLCWK